MEKLTFATHLLKCLLTALDGKLLLALVSVLRRIIASVDAFESNEVSPHSSEKFERRLKRLGREFSKLILENIPSTRSKPSSGHQLQRGNN
jgi:hypothetical protein